MDDPRSTDAAELADPESVARSIVLRRLSGAPQTRHQLDQAMARKGVPDTVRADVLDRFTEVGLVDDAAFAAAWVQSRQARRGLSARALAEELRRRGVDADLIREAVSQVDPDDEEAAARDLVRRKFATMGRLDAATQSRRLTAMLGRKGYPAGVAFRIVKEIVGEMPDESFDL